ncbi:MAG: flavin reductase family protein [Syntrophomonadaceae bacterium]|jgi:flavin reductase (DIM6/NTAB) family NADH-FMN oxidoreductase RutF|nr:flavin reductase family protein [Syntrophomonadaceae bacterium]
MSEQISYNAMAQELLGQLPRGAFLSVRAEERINTMTIGWGSLGYFWNLPVLMVAVRYSRYTYDLMEEARDFSVSVPLNSDFKKSLAGTGSQSGRDIDKFKVFSLKAEKGKSIESPVIGSCGLVYECRLIFKQTMDPALLAPELRQKFYSQEDYHVMYYGEIVSTYLNKN